VALTTIKTETLPLISLSIDYQIAFSMDNGTMAIITVHLSYGDTTAAHF
jgi:hypothetical protein